MAIGDCFAALMGTAVTDRQPSAGVFEEISMFSKFGTSDGWNMFDGSNVILIFETANILSEPTGQTGAPAVVNPYNTAIKIGNTIYLRKSGTADRFGISGVQVDA